MASTSNFVIALALLVSLYLLHVAEGDQMKVNSNPDAAGSSIDCGSACTARCQLSSRPKLCHRACGTCCARCKCVPPGTYGNYDRCPCYANMTTHGGRRKCP